MTTDQTILFALFTAVFALLLWGRWRYDLVAFAALMVGAVTGVVPKDQVFTGFGHPATLIVALVLVVSAGLVNSGAVLLITRTLVNPARTVGLHIALMGGIGALLSAFMNNVAALALLMPVDIATARKAGRAAGRTLMPLSFATILGGMVTLIGTPPNIIIATIREESLGAPFGMFDFAPVGGVVAVAGLAFVAVLGWRLIPAQAGAAPDHAPDDVFLAELTVPADNPVVGKRLEDLEDEAARADVTLVGIIRGGRRLYGNAAKRRIEPEDVLVLNATPEALDEFRAALNLSFVERAHAVHLDGDGLVKFEAVVPDTARIAGKTAQAVGLRWRKRAVLLGILREGRPVRSQLRRTVIRPGDILLLLASADARDEVTTWLGVLPLSERDVTVTQQRKVWLAIALFGGAVLAASLGWLYMPVALGLVVTGFVLARIVPLSELYSHVEWPVVVLLGAMIPLGAALESSGGTELIAGALLELTAGLPAWAVLTVLMVVTMTLSDVLNNTATTIVAAPVGISMAQGLGVSADPFLMTVAVAASCAFLTPIGHKNNTLILGPGGYRFGDYWRMGLPLELLVIAVSVPAILAFWPLGN